MAATAPFACDCGQIKGQVAAVPAKGNHLVCYCDSCRAGALYCSDAPATGEPVDLYLSPPQHVTISTGLDQLIPFAFGPKGVIRWKAACCGVQMFSSQPDPKIAFMSVRKERFADPAQLGPVVTRAFVPVENGKTRHEGKGALARLILNSVFSRISGNWRKAPLYDPATWEPITEVRYLSKDEKRALLS